MGVNWEIRSLEFGNCNCGYACPCQFNALPTYGNCEAVAFFNVNEGHFGDTRLDGLKMGMAIAWPGPVHEGRGSMQPIIDIDADEAQRHALVSILTGKETGQMATVFAVYSAMCDTIHDPVFAPIRFEADMTARRADCEADGIAKARGEPILNPVTGAEHQVGIHMGAGFEFERNEVGRGWSSSTGSVPLVIEDSYAHWCEVNLNQHGVIR